MKKIFLLVAMVAFLGMAVVAFANPAAPTGDIKLAEIMKSNKKAPVTFNHEPHAKAKLDCKVCHHTWKEADGAPKKCSECHTARKSGDKLNNKVAMHKSCKDCHKKMKKAGKKTGPPSCKGCHKK